MCCEVVTLQVLLVHSCKVSLHGKYLKIGVAVIDVWITVIVFILRWVIDKVAEL